MTTATVSNAPGSMEQVSGPSAYGSASSSVRATGAAGRLSFDGVLRSEWIKLLSLRSIRWSIALMLVLSWAGAALMASAMAGSDFVTPQSLPSLLVQAAALGSMFTVLIMGVIGVLAITSEHSSGLIRSTLTAVPTRTPVLVAKALVVAVLALGVGAVSVFGGALIAAVIFGDGALGVLGEPAVLASLGGTTAYLVLATVLALGIGAMLRSSAGAISVVVTLLFVSTIVLQVLTMTGWEWVPQVSQWMPAELGTTLAQAPIMPAEATVGVGYWAALGGLAAWAAAALIPAFLLLKQRDAV